MNFDDIVDAMHYLRSDGYEAEKLIVGHDEHADLLSDANMMQASSTKSSPSNQQVGTVAGADVEVKDVATPLLEGKASNHTRAVPVLESGVLSTRTLTGTILLNPSKQ